MKKADAITLHAKHENWGKFPVFVWDELGVLVTEVDGKIFRAKTPFGLDSELSLAGIPAPRNLYHIDEPDYEEGQK
jgi:hypothetical protein